MLPKRGQTGRDGLGASKNRLVLPLPSRLGSAEQGNLLPYVLSISDSDAVRTELDQIDAVCRDVFPKEKKAREILRRATSEETRSAYADQLDHVWMFLAEELDPDTEQLGFGRLNKHDAPPRTGDKLRKQLRQDGAMEAVGNAMEMLLLSGFAAQAGLTTEPGLAQGREQEEVMRLWKGLIFWFYADTDLPKVLFLEEGHEPSVDLDIRVFADRGLNAYVEAGEQYGFVNFKPGFNVRRMAKTGRAMTFAYLAVSAGRALHRSLTAAAT